jgi:Glycosyltransferase Family 4
MKIGIDISQLAYEKTGVANYLKSLVSNLITLDNENDYVLFFSSLRRKLDYSFVNGLTSSRVSFRFYKLPPSLLDLVWNKLHIMPIENLIGDVDIFITSDWTEPPTKRAKKMTILYDLIIYKYPQETADKIVATQKRKLAWVKKESDMVLCISEATKRDAIDVLGINEKRLEVIYPGV